MMGNEVQNMAEQKDQVLQFSEICTEVSAVTSLKDDDIENQGDHNQLLDMFWRQL